jgi:hypothetical protein
MEALVKALPAGKWRWCINHGSEISGGLGVTAKAWRLQVMTNGHAVNPLKTPHMSCGVQNPISLLPGMNKWLPCSRPWTTLTAVLSYLQRSPPHNSMAQ